MVQNKLVPQKPTGAFIGASWSALLIGMVSFCAGLWNANMELSEKGYYFAILILGLLAVISLQKTIRDRSEDIPVTGIYYGITWLCVVIALLLLAVGLWNTGMLLSEKGFYGIAMLFALFGAICVQKNVRDTAVFAEVGEKENEPKRNLISSTQETPRPAMNAAARPDPNAMRGRSE